MKIADYYHQRKVFLMKLMSYTSNLRNCYQWTVSNPVDNGQCGTNVLFSLHNPYKNKTRCKHFSKVKF